MNQEHRDPAGQVAAHRSPELRRMRNVPASEERRKHLAKPANVGAVIAIRKPRRRQVRPAKRTEIPAEFRRQSAEGAALQSESRRQVESGMNRMRGDRPDSQTNRSHERRSRSHRAKRASISNSIHSARISWNSLRRLAMRLRRESSKPSRQFCENLSRDSSGGCVLPMGRPSPDCGLPSAGGRVETVTCEARAAIVPGSQYLRKRIARWATHVRCISVTPGEIQRWQKDGCFRVMDQRKHGQGYPAHQ